MNLACNALNFCFGGDGGTLFTPLPAGVDDDGNAIALLPPPPRVVFLFGERVPVVALVVFVLGWGEREEAAAGGGVGWSVVKLLLCDLRRRNATAMLPDIGPASSNLPSPLLAEAEGGGGEAPVVLPLLIGEAAPFAAFFFVSDVATPSPGVSTCGGGTAAAAAAAAAASIFAIDSAKRSEQKENS